MNIQTSISNPIRFDVIEPADWSGRLGLTIAPGKKGESMQSGYRHERDLSADFAALKTAGVDLLVNLMELPEGLRYGMADYDAEAERLGLAVRRFPIVDVKVPSDIQAFSELVSELHAELTSGKTVVVHCLGGKGRSGTLAACLLIYGGMNAEDAITLTRRCRHEAIEAAQPQFVRSFYNYLYR
ncbi:cyclin-dependent kinase inhibitor 3 family protein [Deinococcus sp.]|uniref:cyclin-dependent kinase inhibitor 3 family protein n=1 Tax=Deinococcus sp. TaxID=47478 RepID=UPI0025D6B782|nr:cyclin-dependent kinase inhibitor 3 family protein [Deinococcus sp.]